MNAMKGAEAVIKALLTAKADVHAKADVRVGEGGFRLGGRGGGAWGLHCTIVDWKFEPAALERPNL